VPLTPGWSVSSGEDSASKHKVGIVERGLQVADSRREAAAHIASAAIRASRSLSALHFGPSRVLRCGKGVVSVAAVPG
jgi:hypothetical protein